MTILRVNIDNQSDAKSLATFLRTLKYVKSVSVEKAVEMENHKDWILSGPPVTEEELDHLIEEMENENDPGITSAQLEKEIAQWSKGIYK